MMEIRMKTQLNDLMGSCSGVEVAKEKVSVMGVGSSLVKLSHGSPGARRHLQSKTA
jgi:hypothetical protein